MSQFLDYRRPPLESETFVRTAAHAAHTDKDLFRLYAEFIGKRRGYAWVKRGMDIAISLPALLLALPFFLVMAIVIRIDSPGPVFIRQERIGKTRRNRLGRANLDDGRRKRNLYGAPFQMLKFRTMHSDVPLYAATAWKPDDGRVTRVGRVLRRTGLDELPQLVNVLKGEMSLVGPRPEMPFIVNKYSRLEACRLLVRPGLTGYWQINAPRDRHIHEVLHYDMYYLRNRGLKLDLEIMLKTVGYILSMKNK